MPSPFGKEHDMKVMQMALKQAQKALRKNEVPIGAVVVDEQGKILAQGYNMVESKSTQAAHAEVKALAKAGKIVGNWRLEGCWVYVTVQPCGMCMALIQLSRCAGVLYGANSPLFGYHLVDNDMRHSLYKKDIMHIESGVAAQKAAELMKEFFKSKREKQ